MENRESFIEGVKVKVDLNDVHKKSIESSVYTYVRTKYINVINEINLVKKILECCREDDAEIKQQYLSELEELEGEKWSLFNRLQEIDVYVDNER